MKYSEVKMSNIKPWETEEFKKKHEIRDKVQNIRAQKNKPKDRYYNLNSILGNDWAIFYIIIGARKTGKSYAVTDFLLKQHKKLGNKCKNYWLRISETSTKAMLVNKADKLVDPDLKRKYDVDFTTKAMEVYNHGELFCTVAPLSAFAKLKGVGFYDKDFDGWYNIVLDEFQLEQNERRTSFDILYNFIGMVENIIRTTKSKVRVFLLGNTLQESASILKAFNFIPHSFGRFYLKSKKCVIDNIEPTEEYLNDRKGSISDILGGDDMSNYTNQLELDYSSIFKGRTKKLTGLIKFGKERNKWYSIYDGNVVRRYKNEIYNELSVFSMKPYLSSFYNKERVETILDMYDARVFKYDSLITQAYFESDLKLLRKS